MLQIINHSTDPAFNLAVEEYYLKQTELQDDIFLLWRNRPAVVIGKNQNLYEEVNLAYAQEQGIHIVRRMSGGGAVYHDEGNLNFTIIKKDAYLRKHDFRSFLNPVIDALQSMGVPAEFSGRNDIVAEGKKISGNAQYFYRNRALHHGTLLFNSDLSALSSVLNPRPMKFTAKGVDSVRSRVGNIGPFLREPVDIFGFQKVVERAFWKKYGREFSQYKILPEEWEEIDKLADRKYRTWQWTYGAAMDMKLWNEIKMEGGMISLYIKVEKGRIESIHFQGDFFEVVPVGELEKQFLGLPWKKEAVEKEIQEIASETYIEKLTSQDLLRLFEGIPL